MVGLQVVSAPKIEYCCGKRRDHGSKSACVLPVSQVLHLDFTVDVKHINRFLNRRRGWAIAYMAMGQNPVPPVNIQIPTKID